MLNVLYRLVYLVKVKDSGKQRPFLGLNPKLPLVIARTYRDTDKGVLAGKSSQYEVGEHIPQSAKLSYFLECADIFL